MKKLYKDRLLKLAKHLESGDRGHKKFNFEILTNSKGKSCGTVGCAMGELPVVFPGKFKFHDGTIALRKDSTGFFTKDVRLFLGLDYGQDDHLFYPSQQNVERYGGQVMGHLTRPKTVAKQIRAFVEKIEEIDAATRAWMFE